MSFRLYQICRKFILLVFCTLSFCGLVSGLLLSLVQSPETEASRYLLLADQNQEQAIHLTLTALSYAPYDEEIWLKFKNLKRKNLSLTAVKTDLNKSQNLARSDLK